MKHQRRALPRDILDRNKIMSQEKTSEIGIGSRQGNTIPGDTSEQTEDGQTKKLRAKKLDAKKNQRKLDAEPKSRKTKQTKIDAKTSPVKKLRAKKKRAIKLDAKKPMTSTSSVPPRRERPVPGLTKSFLFPLYIREVRSMHIGYKDDKEETIL